MSAVATLYCGIHPPSATAHGAPWHSVPPGVAQPRAVLVTGTGATCLPGALCHLRLTWWLHGDGRGLMPVVNLKAKGRDADIGKCSRVAGYWRWVWGRGDW